MEGSKEVDTKKMECFKETSRGKYQVRLTAEQMEIATSFNKTSNTGKICLALTGKDIYKHRTEQINAIWPFSFTKEEYQSFDYQYWYRKAAGDIGNELVQLLQETAQKHIMSKFKIGNFRIPDRMLNIDYFDISDSLHDAYVTRALHRQVAGSFPYTFPELKEEIDKILNVKSDIEIFIEKELLPIISENYKIAERERRDRRNEQQRLRRAQKRLKSE